MKIFIVEDSMMLITRFKNLLSDLNGVIVIGDAHEESKAISQIKNVKPDLVLLDLGLLKGNGLNVLKRIKRFPGSPLVIILTNSSSALYRRRCLEAGADYFLDKSTEFRQLPSIIKKIQAGNEYREKIP